MFHSQVICVLIVLLLSWGAAEESPSVLLERGIYAEQTAGDLDGAIRIYRRIVEDVEANRQYAADAQYRLSLCYLKKGETAAARAAFEKLIADFPDREDLITKAREQMPAPPFPEVVGCRLKQPVALTLKAPASGAKPAGATSAKVLEVQAFNLIEVSWTLDPAAAGSVSGFKVEVARKTVGSEPIQPVWTAELPPDARRVVIPPNAADGGPAPGDEWALEPGEYEIGISARGKAADQPPVAAGMVSVKAAPLPHTQIMINDLAADGLIRFDSIQQDMNSSTHEVRTKGFQNSDFVHVTGMYDHADRPLKFTTRHIRSSYRYEVTFNKPIPAGQPVLYRSEGTINGLVKRVSNRKDEFEYLMRHHPGGSRPTRRIEVFRLPAGAEILETSPTGMAHREKDGRVELFIDEIVPAGGSIATQFRYRLPGATLADQRALRLEPVPWEDGEELSLEIKTHVGMDAGTFILTARKVRLDTRDVWRLESWLNVPVGDMQQYTRVDADAGTFHPVTGLTRNSEGGTFQATYGPDQVVLKVEQEGETRTHEVPLGATAYDNEQALQMLRRLPLAEGYHIRFPIFPVMGGSVIDCDIQVLGIQKVRVVAGTYECYHIQLAIESNGVRALQHELWISTDKHRYVVKYDEGTATMELTGISKVKPGPSEFTDKEKGLSLTLPEGWRAVRNASPSPYKYMLHMLSPEMKIEALFVMNPLEPEDHFIRDIVEEDAKIVAGFFKNYTVRDGSWTNLTVARRPEAVQYIADYEHEGRSMVEYRTYLIADSMVCWFVFRVEKEKFDAVRPALDQIVTSLRIESKQ